MTQGIMSVYRVTVDDGYQELHYEEGYEENAFLRQHPGPFMTGQFQLHSWDPPEMFDGVKGAKKGKFVLFAPGSMTCTSEAKKKYGHIFERYGELLEFDVRGFNEPLWVFNITNRIDAIDPEKSKEGDGIPGWITEHHFKPEVVNEPMVLRIPQDPAGIYVATNPAAPNNEDFYQLYHSTGGSGLRWKHVWTQS